VSAAQGLSLARKTCPELYNPSNRIFLDKKEYDAVMNSYQVTHIVLHRTWGMFACHKVCQLLENL
jgi:hypothetical protein